MAGYLWKNRDLQRSTEQLIYIAGIVLFQLGLGISEDTSIDNTGHIGPFRSHTNYPNQCSGPTVVVFVLPKAVLSSVHLWAQEAS